ncbi:MAG: accessory gene regulator B family protein [Bacilli bacterium]
MKEVFLNKSMDLLSSKYNYDSLTKDKILYGLEIIYIFITKLSVILISALIFGLFKEMLIFTLLLNGLRTFAYGVHAKKSWHCYISSLVVFILMPYIFINININLIQKIIISILSLISMYVYAPADTEKRPIVNMNQRKKLKLYSFLVCTIYIILSFIIKNEMIINLILLSMITESFIINPFIYKIFNLPYNNYKEYLKNGV